MNKLNRYLWGIVLIGLGIIFGLNATGVTDITIFFPGWWTLFIIVPSVIGLFTDDDKIGSLFGIVIGTLLLLGCLDVIDFGMIWRLLIPAVLVLVGLRIVLSGMKSSDTAHQLAHEQEKHRREKIREGEVVEDEKQEYWSAFSGQKIDYGGKKFTGCKLETAFGSIGLDLRDAKIAKKSVVVANSIFGGIDIVVDKDINVEVSSTSLFGGVSNHHKNADTNKETLYIDAKCIFGGVEIK